MLRTFLATGLVATSGAFFSIVPSRSAVLPPQRRLPFARCPSPVAMADGSDDTWTDADDSLLAQQLRVMRGAQTRCGRPESVLAGLNEAWVLIFNAGQHDEGVYTLQGQQSAATYVLTFEYNDDAERFATLLQGEGFDMATPISWDRSQLSTFCDAGGFEVSHVPEGAIITPPTKNEYDIDAYAKVYQGDGLDPDLGMNSYAAQRSAFENLFNNEGYNEGLDPTL